MESFQVCEDTRLKQACSAASPSNRMERIRAIRTAYHRPATLGSSPRPDCVRPEALQLRQQTWTGSQSLHKPNLLTGFMKCGSCGANLIVVSGRGKLNHPRYGCPQNFNRGACTNGVKERAAALEAILFAELQNAVLRLRPSISPFRNLSGS